jgi:ATP synthase protein I
MFRALSHGGETKGKAAGRASGMTEKTPPPDDKSPLEDFDARLRKAMDAHSAKEGGGVLDRGAQGPVGVAFRIGTELIAAMIVGVGGGMLFDHWLGTAPWGLIIWFFLGAAAGILNVYRAISGLGYATGYRRIELKDNARPDGGDAN